MKEKRILLISFDKEYIDKILSELPFLLNDSSKLVVISNEEYYKEYITQDHSKIDVLIADENLSREELYSQPAEQTFFLVEGADGKNTISKYDAARGIANKLSDTYVKTINESAEKTKIIDVCSVSGGCGKTKAAMGIAGRLSQMGYNVLYVDAEEIQNFVELLPENMKEDFAEPAMAIAFMNGGNADMLAKDIRKAPFDYIPAFKEPIYAYNISLQAYYDMVHNIAAKEIYDYIVVEHTPSLTKELAKYLSDSKMVAICAKDGEAEPQRVKRLVGNLVDFSGQCVVIISAVYEAGEININKKTEEYIYPVCEIVPAGNETHTDIEKILKENRYGAAATAVK